MKAGKLGILSVGLIFGLSACDIIGGGGPAITSFSATPSSITAGQSSVLAWSVDSSATTISISGGVGTVTTDPDDRVTVTPTATTTYTLTATNAEGSSSTDTATVTIVGGGTNTGGTTPPPPPATGDGSFGVSTTATGTFTNDTGEAGPIISNTDPRIISVAAGSTFYAQVQYEDPAGISNIQIVLVNDDPENLDDGPLPSAGFEVTGEPTGDCDLGTATSVTCVYAITVAPGTVDIGNLPEANDEFAYVFRPLVTNGAGASTLVGVRGYVNIQ